MIDWRPTLAGRHVRLEPLELSHVDGLTAAAQGGGELYRWTPVPQTVEETTRYIQIALDWREQGTAVPFAIVLPDGTVAGTTRFWNFERWNWPAGHPEHGRRAFEGCEIGHTWLAPFAVRTAVNTESKVLMMEHAFEVWQVLRVCLHTDARNARSRAAIERIGGKLEGILRAHRMASDFIPRDSARYSILEGEWPQLKERLRAGLTGTPA